jgi:hypothetical protein
MQMLIPLPSPSFFFFFLFWLVDIIQT